MSCACENVTQLDSNESLKYQKQYLSEIKVDGKNWRILYKCKVCNSYWEEIDLNGRFGLEVEFKKITKEDIASHYPDLII